MGCTCRNAPGKGSQHGLQGWLTGCSRQGSKGLIALLAAAGAVAIPWPAQAGILSALSGGIQSVEQTFAQSYQQLTNQGREITQGQSNLMTGQDQQLTAAQKQSMMTTYQGQYDTCTAATQSLCASNRGQTMNAAAAAATAAAAGPAMTAGLLNGGNPGSAAPNVTCTSKNCYGYNAGRKFPSITAAIQSTDSAPPQDFAAEDSLLPSVKASATAGLKQMNAFVAAVALPRPYPALPATESNTAAGKDYQALQRIDNAQTSLSQAALVSIGIMNIPNIAVASATANAGTASDITAAMNSAATANGTPGFVSSDQFLESSVQSTFYNPKWYASVASQAAGAPSGAAGGGTASSASSSSTTPTAPSASSGTCNPSAWKNGIKDKALIPSIQAASAASGIPAATIAAIMGNESSGGNCAANPAACGQNPSSSATGPMQMENGAAATVCSQYSYCPNGNSPSMNYTQNIKQGALYLKYLNNRYASNNQTKLAIAYNQGPGYVVGGKGVTCVYDQNGCVADQGYVTGFQNNLACPGAFQTGSGNPTGQSGGSGAVPTAGAGGYSPLLAEYRLMLAAQDLQERYRVLRTSEYLEASSALRLADDTRAAFAPRLAQLRAAAANGQANN